MPRKQNLSAFFIDFLSNPLEAVSKHGQKALTNVFPESGVVIDVAKHLADKSVVRPRAMASQVENIGSPQMVFDSIKDEGWGIIGVVGLPGSGKTYLSIWLARHFNKKHYYALGMKDYDKPENFIKISSIGEIRTLPQGSCVILDDAAQSISLSTYGRKSGEDLINLINDVRHRKMIIIMNVQNTTQINRHILDLNMMLIFKLPSQDADAERPRYKKVYQRVQQAFFEHYYDREWIHHHFYLYSPIWSGIIKY